MKRILIVGLGNKGKQYQFTRHNVGFLFLDYFAKQLVGHEVDFTLNKKFDVEILQIENYILIKPQTYMNLSGSAVKKVKEFYNIESENIIIIQDDIERNIGSFIFSFHQQGAGGHNGIRSIHEIVGKNIHRVRIGVGKGIEEHGLSVSNFVLSDFKEEELKTVASQFQKITENILQLK